MGIQERVEAHLRARGGYGLGAVEVERPLWGRNSEVFLLNTHAGVGGVLRAFRTLTAARRYATTLWRFSERQAPIPPLLDFDDRLATWLRHRRAFCLEHFVEGELLIDAGVDDATLDVVLQSLARLHEIQSTVWGSPLRPSASDYRQAMRREALSQLRGIPRRSPYLRSGDRARFRTLVESTWECWPEPARFSLVHGKLGTDDIVISTDRAKATFIDLDGLHFGHFAHDLFSVLYDLAGVSGVGEADLAGRYLKHRTTEAALDYAASAPFFRVRHHLRKLANAHRRSRRKHAIAERRARFHYAQLCRLAHSQ